MSSRKIERPTISKFCELKPGEPAIFYVILAEKKKNSTREGKVYYSCKFRDSRRTGSVMIWADSVLLKDCEEKWAPGKFFKIQGVFHDHDRYGPQIEIDAIRAVEKSDEENGFDVREFIKKSRFDPSRMHAELIEVVSSHVKDSALLELTLGLLQEHSGKLLNLPATERTFYPFAGGWLEHTLSVTKKVARLAMDYAEHHDVLIPPINVELVVAASALHEIGKVAELELPAMPTDPVLLTTDGRFYGHVLLARDMIRDAARKIENFDPLMLKLLEHIVLSHLTLPEWGSPRLPLIPEVLILHHADDLDAKMEMYVRCLSNDGSDGEFTDRDPVLGKRLFKARFL